MTRSGDPMAPPLDLALEEATSGVSAVQRARLDLLLASEPGLGQSFLAYEVTAAAVHCDLLERDGLEEMPLAVRRRLGVTFGSPGTGTPLRVDGRPSGFRRLLAWSGWLAAAASLSIWLQRPAPDSRHPEPAPSDLRDSLLREPGVVRWDFKAVAASHAGVTGDVVWSDPRQEGVLRFVGLGRNDPRRSQFQLWIVDADRQRHPVDGGVFDVAAEGGAVFIRVRSKLPVEGPDAFVITEEQPGGVVVSDGPHLLLAAR